MQISKVHVTNIVAEMVDVCVLLLVGLDVYLRGGFVPTLEDGGTVHGNLVILERSPLTSMRQRVFGVGCGRENQTKKQSFFLMIAEDGDEELAWVGKVLILCRLSFPTVQDFGEYLFVKYMEVSKALSGVDRILRCVYLRWATEDEVDMTLNIGESRRNNKAETEEWFGLVYFISIVRMVPVLRSSIAIHPFPAEFLRTLNRLYVNQQYISWDENLDTTSPETCSRFSTISFTILCSAF